MDVLIIVIVLLLGFAVWYCLRLQYVKIGSKFVAMCGGYLSIIEQSQILDVKSLSELPPMEFEQGFFKAVYDPQRPKSFFDQMEYAYENVHDLYDRIEYHEDKFRKADWTNIRIHHQMLENTYFQMRLIKWRNYGLK